MTLSKEAERRIERRLRTLQHVFGVHKTPDDIIEAAIHHYLILRENRQHFKAVRRRYFTALYNRQHGLCHYCHKHIPSRRATIDHRIPVGRGGSWFRRSNMVVTCKRCNSDKGNLTEEEYFFALQYRKSQQQV